MIRKISAYSHRFIFITLTISAIVHLLIVANIVFVKRQDSGAYVEIALLSKSEERASSKTISTRSAQNKEQLQKKIALNNTLEKTETVHEIADDTIADMSGVVADSGANYRLKTYDNASIKTVKTDIAKPTYPAVARERGYEGTVILLATISVGNVVDNIEVQSSSGYRILDRAAIDAVKKSKFNINRDTITIKYEFLLNETP